MCYPILKNPFYFGQFHWNGKTYEGDHSPLVSAGLFRRTQEALRKGNYPVRESKRSFAYTGLTECAHCGCAITAGLHKGKYVYYRCTGAPGECEAKLIRENRLEELLGELVKAVKIDEDMVEWIVAALRESHRDEKAYNEGRVQRLQAELGKVRARMDAAYEDKLDGRISEELWERRSGEWRERRLELQVVIGRHHDASDMYYDAGVRVLRLAQRVYPPWLAQPQSERRKLLDVLLLTRPMHRLVVDGMKWSLCRRGAGSDGDCLALALNTAGSEGGTGRGCG